jgi:hypothetical protein
MAEKGFKRKITAIFSTKNIFELHDPMEEQRKNRNRWITFGLSILLIGLTSPIWAPFITPIYEKKSKVSNYKETLAKEVNTKCCGSFRKPDSQELWAKPDWKGTVTWSLRKYRGEALDSKKHPILTIKGYFKEIDRSSGKKWDAALDFIDPKWRNESYGKVVGDKFNPKNFYGYFNDAKISPSSIDILYIRFALEDLKPMEPGVTETEIWVGGLVRPSGGKKHFIPTMYLWKNKSFGAVFYLVKRNGKWYIHEIK